MKIDSHQHFWKYHPVKDAWITDEMKVIQRDFMPEDLFPVLRENKFEGCVTVQADQSEAETMFLLGLAAEHDFIKGVVGWIDLKADELEEKLERFRSHQVLKGFRHIVQAEPDGFLTDDKFVKGVSLLGQYGYSYDVLIYPRQLEEALAFIQRLPQQRLVIDHSAKPAIRNREIDDWAVQMRKIAAHKKVYCKLSGLFTEAEWKEWRAEDFYPYLDVVVDAFGPDRIMFGSDWPVCLLAATYQQSCDVLEEYFRRYSDEEKALFWGENAKRFYEL
ncbi:MAG: amidohydrolase family protein [Chitinophagaceae bacterium]